GRRANLPRRLDRAGGAPYAGAYARQLFLRGAARRRDARRGGRYSVSREDRAGGPLGGGARHAPPGPPGPPPPPAGRRARRDRSRTGDDDRRRARQEPLPPRAMTRDLAGRRFDEASLREPLRGALAAREVRKVALGSRTAAAVLIPLFEREGEVHL